MFCTKSSVCITDSCNCESLAKVVTGRPQFQQQCSTQCVCNVLLLCLNIPDKSIARGAFQGGTVLMLRDSLYCLVGSFYKQKQGTCCTIYQICLHLLPFLIAEAATKLSLIPLRLSLFVHPRFLCSKITKNNQSSAKFCCSATDEQAAHLKMYSIFAAAPE